MWTEGIHVRQLTGAWEVRAEVEKRKIIMMMSSPSSSHVTLKVLTIKCDNWLNALWALTWVERAQYSNGIRAEWPGFESWQEQDSSLLHSIQTGSWAQPAYSGYQKWYPRGQSSWCMRLTIHLHLVLRPKMVQLCMVNNIFIEVWEPSEFVKLNSEWWHLYRKYIGIIHGTKF
jgi:hypothetical protein